MSLEIDYKNEIKKLSDVIRKKYKPEKIILFGSCAYGKIKPSSDIDMLIVKNSRKKSVERVKDVLFLTDNNLPFEPLVYSPKEIKERLDKGDFFIRNILKKGKVLYEKR